MILLSILVLIAVEAIILYSLNIALWQQNACTTLQKHYKVVAYKKLKDKQLYAIKHKPYVLFNYRYLRHWHSKVDKTVVLLFKSSNDAADYIVNELNRKAQIKKIQTEVQYTIYNKNE